MMDDVVKVSKIGKLVDKNPYEVNIIRKMSNAKISENQK